MTAARRPASERFWDLVNGPWCDARIGGDDCWLWMGGTAGSRPPRTWGKDEFLTSRPWKRYGRFRGPDGRQINAHRYALELVAGEAPADAVAGHRCDRPLCCNPLHLAWISPAANLADAMAKRHIARDSQLGRFVSLAAAVVE